MTVFVLASALATWSSLFASGMPCALALEPLYAAAAELDLDILSLIRQA